MINIGNPPVAATTQQIEQLKTDMNLGLAYQMQGLEPSVRDGVGSPCTLGNFIGNTVLYYFEPGVNEEAYLQWDVPFDWATGTDIYAAVHWTPNASTNTGNVRWGFEFVSAAVDQSFPETPAFFYVNAPVDGTARKSYHPLSDPYPGSAASHNMRFVMRFFRDGLSPLDTFPDNAYLIGIDFYYQTNKSGQATINPPYA